MTPRPKITDELASALERLLKVEDLLPEVERRMRASLSEPGGHGFEVVSRPAVLYCEHHERDFSDCEHAARKADVPLACTGVPVDAPNDPTGDGAARDEAIRDEVRRFEAHARAVILASSWIRGFVERWMRDDRAPLRDPKATDHAQPRCEWHERYGYEVPAEGKHPTRVRYRGKALLLAARHLCRWCGDDVRQRFEKDGEARLPTEGEILTHAAKTGLIRIGTRETGSAA